jgi:hypothetical protein
MGDGRAAERVVSGGPASGPLPWERRSPPGGGAHGTPGARSTAGGMASGPLPVLVATVALIGSVGLSAVRLLLPDVLPAAAVVATVGFVLTPWVVMAMLVLVQGPLLRGDDADPARPVAAERSLRRLHVLAVLALVASVPHVVVLAQLFELWWSGR